MFWDDKTLDKTPAQIYNISMLSIRYKLQVYSRYGNELQLVIL